MKKLLYILFIIPVVSFGQVHHPHGDSTTIDSFLGTTWSWQMELPTQPKINPNFDSIGSVYIDSTTNIMYWHNGIEWTQLSGGGGGSTTITGNKYSIPYIEDANTLIGSNIIDSPNNHSYILDTLTVDGQLNLPNIILSLSTYKVLTIDPSGFVHTYFPLSNFIPWADTGTIIATIADLTAYQPIGSYVPTSRTLTINGTAFDLTAPRSWNVGTVTKDSAGYGMSGGNVTTTGYKAVDTTKISTKAYAHNQADSVAGLIPSVTGYMPIADSNALPIGYVTKTYVGLNFYPLTGNPSGFITFTSLSGSAGVNYNSSTGAFTLDYTYAGTFTNATWHGVAIADGYIASAANWNQAYHKYPVSATYSNGTITFTNNDGSTWTVTGLNTGTVQNVIAGTNIAIAGTSTIQPTVSVVNSPVFSGTVTVVGNDTVKGNFYDEAGISYFGTIGAGTWNGGTIGVGYGGTGATTTTSINLMPITYGANNTLKNLADTFTAGRGITGGKAAHLNTAYLDTTENYLWPGANTWTNTAGIVELQSGVTELSGITGVLADFEGTNNSFLQLNVRNQNSGNNASSDLVATADNGTNTTHYVNVGINGSGFYQPGTWGITSADGAYVISGTDTLTVGTLAAEPIIFHTGGALAANIAMIIDASGSYYFSTLSTGIAHISSLHKMTSSAVNLASADVTGLLPSANLAATAVTAGSYGSSTQIPGFTVNAEGQITGVTLYTVSGGGGTDSGIIAGAHINITRGSTYDIVATDGTTTPTASVLVSRDGNGDMLANSVIASITTYTASATKTTLVVGSAYYQNALAINDTFVLPVVGTLQAGKSFLISDSSAGNTVVLTSGGTMIQLMAPGTQESILIKPNNAIEAHYGGTIITSLTNTDGNITWTNSGGVYTANLASNITGVAVNNVTLASSSGSAVTTTIDYTGHIPVVIAQGTTSATSSTSEANLVAITIPSGMMSAKGLIEGYVTWVCTGVSGVRSVVIRVGTSSGATSGGSTIFSSTGLANNTLALRELFQLQNLGSTSTQSGYVGSGFGASTTANINPAINTATTTFYININAYVGNASDNIYCFYSFRLLNN